MTNKERKEKLVTMLYCLTVVLILVLSVKYLLAALIPFIIAFIIAFALKKPIDKLTQKTKVSRAFWSFALIVLSIALLLSALSFIGYRIYLEAWQFLKQVPDYISSTETSIDRIIKNIAKNSENDYSKTIRLYINTSANNIISKGTSYLSSTAISFIRCLPSYAIGVVVTLLASFFITRDYHKIASFACKVLPLRTINNLSEIKKNLTTNTFKIIRGYSIISAITFAELFIGLLLIGVDNALLISLGIAVVDILPILGTGTVMVPWMIIEALNGKIALSVELLVLYIIITVIRNFIEPRIVSKQVGLDPLASLVAMYLGFHFLNVAGLILAPLALSVTRDFFVNKK